MKPITLSANQPPARFYKGGEKISEFRGIGAAAPNTPEDWVGSTTSVRGQAPTGMTRLDSGELLLDAIEKEPLKWLGPNHVERFGSDCMLLVKLLDAGQRLPIHAHPDGEFAASYVASLHGKAEAWFILSPGTVYLSLKRDVPLAELSGLVDTQDISTLLPLMHELAVSPGDCIFVPHGVLHAIGEGVFLAEVQEPEDLSILLEWEGFELDGSKDGHLGVGFDVALTAVETTARSRGDVERLIRRAVTQGNALVEEASQYFRLDRVEQHTDFPAGFGIVIALDSPIALTNAKGEKTKLSAGSTTLMPFDAGPFSLEGSSLVARPPLA